jgi:molybdopterin molybdotransferase
VFSRARLDLSVESARERIYDRVEPLSPIDVPIQQALGLRLASDLVAPIELPLFTNSAMDGIALASGFTVNATPVHPAFARVAGKVDAGETWSGTVPPGHVVRIGTGAPLPDGCDTVLAAEQVEERDGIVTFASPVPPGQHVRLRGEDVRIGATVVTSGTTMRPQEIGLLAALGITAVEAHPRPAVTIISTGPELSRDSAPALVNDANGPMLAALATTAGAEVVDILQTSGDLEDIFVILDRCAETSDLVITSGGISNSLADTMADLLEPHEQGELWNVRLRPGKHFGFAWFDDFYLLSIPGNPIAALVGFELFGRTLIDRLMDKTVSQQTATATATEPFSGKLGRTDAIRGRAWRDADGRLFTTPTENRGSSVLSSLLAANCLILLPEDVAVVEPGQHVSIQWIGYQ